jgi:hypothetical protein
MNQNRKNRKEKSMHTYASKTQVIKVRSIKKTATPPQKGNKPTLQLTDSRPGAVAQLHLQEMAKGYSQANQTVQLQAIANSQTVQPQLPIQSKSLSTKQTRLLSVPSLPTGCVLQQRKAVKIETQRMDKVVIATEGQAKEFKGGSSAKDNGWNGVDKYKARAKVGKNTPLETPTLNNNFLNAQAGHILAQQNGGDGSDPNNVFAQDGGVNNSAYRSILENPMRTQLDTANDEDKVFFRVSLYGDPEKEEITQGSLNKVGSDLERSEEETDFEGFSSDEEAVLSFEKWKARINQMTWEVYEIGIDDLPDQPYMSEYEDGMSPEDFFDEYMKDYKAYWGK